MFCKCLNKYFAICGQLCANSCKKWYSKIGENMIIDIEGTDGSGKQTQTKK